VKSGRKSHELGKVTPLTGGSSRQLGDDSQKLSLFERQYEKNEEELKSGKNLDRRVTPLGLSRKDVLEMNQGLLEYYISQHKAKELDKLAEKDISFIKTQPTKEAFEAGKRQLDEPDEFSESMKALEAKPPKYERKKFYSYVVPATPEQDVEWSKSARLSRPVKWKIASGTKGLWRKQLDEPSDEEVMKAKAESYLETNLEERHELNRLLQENLQKMKKLDYDDPKYAELNKEFYEISEKFDELHRPFEELHSVRYNAQLDIPEPSLRNQIRLMAPGISQKDEDSIVKTVYESAGPSKQRDAVALFERPLTYTPPKVGEITPEEQKLLKQLRSMEKRASRQLGSKEEEEKLREEIAWKEAELESYEKARHEAPQAWKEQVLYDRFKRRYLETRGPWENALFTRVAAAGLTKKELIGLLKKVEKGD